MVSQHVECASLHEVPEMSHREVDCKELPVKGAVRRFCGFEGLGEVGNGLPVTIDELLKDGTNSNVMMHMAASGLGWTRRITSARPSFALLKAESTSSLQVRDTELLLE